MKYKEFKKWVNDRWVGGYLSYEVYHAARLLIHDIDTMWFWERRQAWKNIEIEIVEHVVIPINQEIRFKEIRDAKRK